MDPNNPNQPSQQQQHDPSQLDGGSGFLNYLLSTVSASTLQPPHQQQGSPRLRLLASNQTSEVGPASSLVGANSSLVSAMNNNRLPMSSSSQRPDPQQRQQQSMNALQLPQSAFSTTGALPAGQQQQQQQQQQSIYFSMQGVQQQPLSSTNPMSAAAVAEAGDGASPGAMLPFLSNANASAAPYPVPATPNYLMLPQQQDMMNQKLLMINWFLAAQRQQQLNLQQSQESLGAEQSASNQDGQVLAAALGVLSQFSQSQSPLPSSLLSSHASSDAVAARNFFMAGASHHQSHNDPVVLAQQLVDSFLGSGAGLTNPVPATLATYQSLQQSLLSQQEQSRHPAHRTIPNEIVFPGAAPSVLATGNPLLYAAPAALTISESTDPAGNGNGNGNPSVDFRSSFAKASSRHQSGNGDDSEDDGEQEGGGELAKSDQDRRKYDHESFAQILHRVLTDLEAQGKHDIMCFVDGGHGGFWFHKPTEFVTKIMPNYFRARKEVTFRRQLISYGFKKEKHPGPRRGAFLHPLFVRGKPDLCKQILRDNRYDKRLVTNAKKKAVEESGARKRHDG